MSQNILERDGTEQSSFWEIDVFPVLICAGAAGHLRILPAGIVQCLDVYHHTSRGHGGGAAACIIVAWCALSCATSSRVAGTRAESEVVSFPPQNIHNKQAAF